MGEDGLGGSAGEDVGEGKSVPVKRELLFEFLVDAVVLGKEEGTYSILRLKVIRSRICMSVMASSNFWYLQL